MDQRYKIMETSNQNRQNAIKFLCDDREPYKNKNKETKYQHQGYPKEPRNVEKARKQLVGTQ